MKKVFLYIFCCMALTVHAQRTPSDVKKIMATKGLRTTDDFDQYGKWQKDTTVRNAVFMMDNHIKDIFTRGIKDTIIRLDDAGGNWLLNIFTISAPSVYESFLIDSLGRITTRGIMQYNSVQNTWESVGVHYQIFDNEHSLVKSADTMRGTLRKSEEALNWQRRIDEYLRRF